MKADIKRFNDAWNYACRTYGYRGMASEMREMRFEFSEYIHNLKASGYMGTGKNGDFTFQELVDMAKEFLEAMKNRKNK